ncbi:MAG: polysulfide reductase NrfD [Candidatus Omnitrophica bacterium]|nr:polysulfide reductase NrfD [Candidatus Omnitrophota bacterium]
MTSYDVFHGIALNWMIPTYFFLGGLSAGLFILSVVFNYWKKEFKVLAKPAAILSPLFLAAGMNLLILDLGKPLRFWKLMVTFQPSSAASWGTWLLSIFFFLNVVHAFFLVTDKDEKAKGFGYAGLLFAFVAATYTGFLLAQMQGKGLWHSPLIPWLFLVGSMISGLALVILAGIVLGKAKELGYGAITLAKTLGWLVVLELALIFTEVLVLLNGSSDAVVGVRAFLTGRYSFLFWAVEIGLGSIIPLTILLSSNRAAKLSLQSIAAILVLVGVFAMRYIVVMAGQI